MRRTIAFLPLLGMMFAFSCTKRDSTEAPAATAEAPKAAVKATQPAESTFGPRAVIHLKNGSKVPGSIVASSRTDIVVAGDDDIERKIPLAQVTSVEYPDSEPVQSARQSPRLTVRPTSPPKAEPAPSEPKAAEPSEPKTAERSPQPSTERAAERPAAPPPAAAVTTRTYELPSGSEVSVRTNEPIDSETATEGQTFDAQLTRDAKDANGDLVIPRGASARVVIKSASRGGRFRGASDLVLDLQSVSISGRQYTIDTVDVTKRGKSGVGVNRRTAEYTGGGAALGAIIGAIAGGGKGAAIGAGAGAGAGALTQVLTKGRAIKVPAESVLTFNLDKPLKVTRAE